MTELKPCPFCGGKMLLVHMPLRKDWWRIIGNHSDDCVFMLFAEGVSEKAALEEAWNRRVGHDSD